MNLKPLMELVTAHAKAVTIVAFVTLASTGYAAWLHEHDARVREQATMQQALATAATRTAHTDTVRLAADTVLRHDSVRVAGRLRTDTLWRTVPETLRTAADTQRALFDLPRIRAQAESTTMVCRAYVSSCSAYRVAAESTMAALRAQLALTTKVMIQQKPSRFSWGLTGGLATVYDGAGWHAGPGVTLGLTTRF